ncbi:MAG: acetate--CoA ligase family protein [Nitrospirota bacterium]|nr:acetate--CoA ligase family protein [Nitrospirota bacterium]
MIEEFMKKAQGRTAFLEHEVKELLKSMGFSVPRGIFIGTGEKIPGDLDLDYPLIAKVSSQKIYSKSDAHGLRAGLGDESELRSAVEELMRIEHAEGVLIEEMAPRGVEVIVGGVIDAQFGPVMMFGLGGVFVEIFRDVSFGLAPLSKDDAYWMIKEVKGKRLLEGYRGTEPLDREALVEILMGVSGIMATGAIGEIDLNPVVLYPEGAMVLDAKMRPHLS